MAKAERFRQEDEAARLILQAGRAGRCASSWRALGDMATLGQRIDDGWEPTKTIGNPTENERTDCSLSLMDSRYKAALLSYVADQRESMQWHGRRLGCGKDAAADRIAKGHEQFWEGYKRAEMLAADRAKRYKEMASNSAPTFALLKR
jgi:hypothetical protein